MTHIAGTPDDDGCKFLSGLIKYSAKSDAEKFPKTAAGLPNAESYFNRDYIPKKPLSKNG